MKCHPRLRVDPVSNAWWPFKKTTEGGFASPAEESWQRHGAGIGRAYRTLPQTRECQDHQNLGEPRGELVILSNYCFPEAVAQL